MNRFLSSVAKDEEEIVIAELIKSMLVVLRLCCLAQRSFLLVREPRGEKCKSRIKGNQTKRLSQLIKAIESFGYFVIRFMRDSFSKKILSRASLCH